MHQVKTDDMFKLLGSTWKVRSVYSGYFCASADSHGGITLDLDKADLLDWVEPEEPSDDFAWTVQATKDFKSEIKREILEEIAEAWDNNKSELCGFANRLRNRAKSL